MPGAESPLGALETELDRLFQAKASAFVSERNQLVQTLRRAGNREAAEAVARLARPTPVAWAINQLHFPARALRGAKHRRGREGRTRSRSASVSIRRPSGRRPSAPSLSRKRPAWART